MARKLKTYVTTSGFFDLAVAAPSMKAALEIWGSKSNSFQQGFAKETDDPDIIRATIAHPGIILRRPVGSRGAFKEHAELPKLSALQNALKRKPPSQPREKKTKIREPKTPDTAATRKAAQLYDLASKRRERQEQRAEAQREKETARRPQVVEKAQVVLEESRAKHEERMSDIAKERAALARKTRNEEEAWDKERNRLEAVLRRAREQR